MDNREYLSLRRLRYLWYAETLLDLPIAENSD